MQYTDHITFVINFIIMEIIANFTNCFNSIVNYYYYFKIIMNYCLIKKDFKNENLLIMTFFGMFKGFIIKIYFID